MAERYAALDIGGTKIAYALVEGGKVMKRYHDKKTPDTELKLFDEIETAIMDARIDGGTKGIGVGIAGPVTDDGRVVKTSNMPLSPGYPLKERLEKTFFTQASVENDTRCFALGVHRYELEGRYNNLVCLTLGTGLGGAVITGGGLERRPTGTEGEIGHTVFKDGGYPCGCGRNGCNEAYVSGRAIEKRFRALGGDETYSAKDIVMASADNWGAEQFLNRIRDNFSVILDRLVKKYDPEAIVLGGSLASTFMLAEGRCKVPLIKSEMEDAALLGAVVPLL